MTKSTATLTITGMTAYSQSQFLTTPMEHGESHDAYNLRVWREKFHTKKIGGKEVLAIKAFALHQCFATGAKYTKKRIKGSGMSTWTKKFVSGIMVEPEVPLSRNGKYLTVDDLQRETNICHADGQRGSGKRVLRSFPYIDSGWQATASIRVLDEAITKEIFTEMVNVSGMVVGIGRFRPENMGDKGRFQIADLDWPYRE